jgi:uncharacterized protein (DUF1330 family)
MNTKFKITIAIFAGAALGAGATQVLHAQAKLKAYSISEQEILDNAAEAAYIPEARHLIDAAHGRSLRTTNGRVVAIEGEAPKHVGLNEWNSVDDAVAYYKSKARADLAPQRDKANKTIRRYVVEVER